MWVRRRIRVFLEQKVQLENRWLTILVESEQFFRLEQKWREKRMKSHFYTIEVVHFSLNENNLEFCIVFFLVRE